MSERYRKLGDAFKGYEQSRVEASTSASIQELQAWHDNQPRAQYLRTLDPREIGSFFLPPAGELYGQEVNLILIPTDRKYRQCVLRHQEKVEKVIAYHNEDLPVGTSCFCCEPNFNLTLYRIT
jgi:hypothetical protein